MAHRLKAVNKGVTTLSAVLGSADTTASVVDASVLPDAPARVVIGSEVIEYGGKNVNDLTSLLRGREGTAGVEHASGAEVINAFTAGYYDEVPSADDVSGKEPTITAGTTSQYWRGDKSWQTLDKTAVGLGNVDNVAQATPADVQAARIRSFLGV